MALENKLGLTSSADLAREEERISKKKAAELFEKGILDNFPVGKFSTLQAIHTIEPSTAAVIPIEPDSILKISLSADLRV